MARRGRPTVEVVLTDDERETLERWAGRLKSAQALALRCRIVLLCADSGRTNTEIAARLGVSPRTVGKWRRRFVERRLDGLHDEPRPGAPRTVTVGGRGTRRPSGGRQCLDAQDPRDPAVAPPSPTIPAHFTATYSSWMNLVERWFAELTNKWLRRGTHRSTKELETSINEWIDRWNESRRHSSGTRAPMRSSTRWLDIARGSLGQHTS